jgi:hypothetical protein
VIQESMYVLKAFQEGRQKHLTIDEIEVLVMAFERNNEIETLETICEQSKPSFRQLTTEKFR